MLISVRSLRAARWVFHALLPQQPRPRQSGSTYARHVLSCGHCSLVLLSRRCARSLSTFALRVPQSSLATSIRKLCRLARGTPPRGTAWMQCDRSSAQLLGCQPPQTRACGMWSMPERKLYVASRVRQATAWACAPRCNNSVSPLQLPLTGTLRARKSSRPALQPRKRVRNMFARQSRLLLD